MENLHSGSLIQIVNYSSTGIETKLTLNSICPTDHDGIVAHISISNKGDSLFADKSDSPDQEICLREDDLMSLYYHIKAILKFEKTQK